MQADRRFHLAVAEMSGNLVLVDLVAPCCLTGGTALLSSLMSDRAESPYSWGAAVAEHEAIVRALESRDPLAAAAAMSGHLHASHGRWLAEPLPGGDAV